MGVHTLLRNVALAAGLAAAAVGPAVVDVIPASASGPTLTGAGSTWVQIALDQWRADVGKPGLTLNYSGVGSRTRRRLYILNPGDLAPPRLPLPPPPGAPLHAD